MMLCSAPHILEPQIEKDRHEVITSVPSHNQRTRHLNKPSSDEGGLWRRPPFRHGLGRGRGDENAAFRRRCSSVVGTRRFELRTP
jgi:hypothetical protein